MAIQQILQSLYGVYSPTGMYSFEFINRREKKSIVEIFMMLPPETVSVTELQRASLTPTITGGFISDFGNEFKDITISGSQNFFYVGLPANPVSIVPPENSLDVLDGYTEFLKLRYMLIRYRDYTMTKNSKVKGPNFGNASQDLAKVEGFKNWVKSQVEEKKKGSLADAVDVIWHNYDDDDHFLIKIEQFSYSRDRRDPFSVTYTITAKAYGIWDAGLITLSAPQKKELPKEWLNDLVQKMKYVHPETIPDKTDSTAEISLHCQGELKIFQNEKIVQADNNIRTMRSSIYTANDDIQAGIVSIRRSLGIIDINLLAEINSLKGEFINTVIPSHLLEDFYAGIYTLQNFTDLDSMSYFGGLLDLEGIVYGLGAAKKIAEDSIERPVSTGYTQTELPDYLDTLSEDEFVDQGSLMPVSDFMQNFLYYTVTQSDTLQNLAIKFYGDYSKWIDIAEVNAIKDNDLLNGSYVGKKIRVPVSGDNFYQFDNNLVYEHSMSVSNVSLEKYFFGSDIKVDNGKMSFDGSGELQLVHGIKCASQNILRRFIVKKGNLTPLSSDFGLSEFDNNTPFFIKLDKILSDIESQAEADPRVYCATIDRSNIRINGDSVYVPVCLELKCDFSAVEIVGVSIE